MSDISMFIMQIIKRYQYWEYLCIDCIGYTMVYGIAKLINFAHGDIIMVGAYVAYVCIVNLHLPIFCGCCHFDNRLRVVGGYYREGCLQTFEKGIEDYFTDYGESV